MGLCYLGRYSAWHITVHALSRYVTSDLHIITQNPQPGTEHMIAVYTNSRMTLICPITLLEFVHANLENRNCLVYTKYHYHRHYYSQYICIDGDRWRNIYIYIYIYIGIVKCFGGPLAAHDGLLRGPL